MADREVGFESLWGYFSLAISAGANVKAVQRMLGQKGCGCDEGGCGGRCGRRSGGELTESLVE